MEVKGTAVKSIDEFVKKQFPSKYNDWLGALPIESKKIFYNGVITNKWYNSHEAAVIPTQKLCELFYDNDHFKGAWECGRYSAESALTGIYKIYVKLSKPGHIIERASRIFAAYYGDSVMSTRKNQANSVEVVIEDMSKPSDVIEYRIGGWIEKALELSGCNDIKVDISKSLAKGSDETVYSISWKN